VKWLGLCRACHPVIKIVLLHTTNYHSRLPSCRFSPHFYEKVTPAYTEDLSTNQDCGAVLTVRVALLALDQYARLATPDRIV
jgi:hypothetical protein